VPPEVIHYIEKYGYLAIFILIFIQEIGVPNPIPNEFVLMFSGYLTFKGILFLPFVFMVALSADFIGTNILYFTFYFFGAYILKHKPRWFPISEKKLNNLSLRISKGGKLRIYIFRLTPFIRGYTSVITGLLQIKPKVFLPIAIFSAMTWSAFYLLIGNLFGPYWNTIENNIGNLKYVLFSILILILLIILIRYILKHRKNKALKSEE
jgi:membrane protein DedA with SNARE-associated domain